MLVIGNISCVASAVWFGLAGSYWEAVAARVLGGALNAIILVEKAMIGELACRVATTHSAGHVGWAVRSIQAGAEVILSASC